MFGKGFSGPPPGITELRAEILDVMAERVHRMSPEVMVWQLSTEETARTGQMKCDQAVEFDQNPDSLSIRQIWSSLQNSQTSSFESGDGSLPRQWY
eukprot:Skav206657  [mRNA]  locus=scaffold1933:587689:587976:+ [translate_table: standard]